MYDWKVGDVLEFYHDDNGGWQTAFLIEDSSDAEAAFLFVHDRDTSKPRVFYRIVRGDVVLLSSC